MKTAETALRAGLESDAAAIKALESLAADIRAGFSPGNHAGNDFHAVMRAAQLLRWRQESMTAEAIEL